MAAVLSIYMTIEQRSYLILPNKAEIDLISSGHIDDSTEPTMH